ncbi:hypothetical protein AAC387_Pa09g0495 [Persea americana]
MDNNDRDSLLTPTSTMSRSESFAEVEVEWPFGKVDVDRDDLRETAYEIFFTSCRSSPGFGGKNALNYYPTWTAGDRDREREKEGGECTSPRSGAMSTMVPSSRIKRALGLKTMKRSSLGRTLSGSGSNMDCSKTAAAKLRRPLTSAELMRHQMKVTEQSDIRLRKTLMRTLVGQMGRRVETIILPLELLRHLKPSEFQDAHEYFLWQRRQLKIIEAGLLQHPSVPLDRSNAFAMSLRDIIRSSESKAIDNGKSCEAMKNLCNAVLALAWRSPNGTPTDSCHWADGFPLNVHLYLVLLQSIFDPNDQTGVLDEVDELTELMKKTWSTLGITRLVHNICFTWVLFHQFVTTGQVEQDLLTASLTMMAEVATDAKRSDREFLYVKILSSTLASMQRWAEKKLLDYHEAFQKGAAGSMETIIPLAQSAAKIQEEDVPSTGGVSQEKEDEATESPGNRVDLYIRSSLQNAFDKMSESKNTNSASEEEGEGEQVSSENLIGLARETEELATKEKEYYSCILKRWQPIAAGVAAVTLHNCYGTVLRHYLTGVSTLTVNTIQVLQTAGKLENVLVQMVVEDSVDCEDGGKGIVREMEPYEVDTVILNLMKSWIEERLKKGRECLEKAKETETWNPKSKTEPHAQSAMEITKLAKEAVDNFFEIPAGGMGEDLIQDLLEGLESLLQDYISFVQSCGGTKQGYVPPLPPLTRCSRDSKIYKLWKKAAPCRVVGMDELNISSIIDGDHPRPSTSRGTQRLYIRVNTLHYLLSSIHSLDKSLTLSIRTHFPNSRRHLTDSPTYFENVRSSIHTATQNVSEVAAFRLIFLDSSSVFYDGLYAGDVTNARIHPALRILKQNLTLLTAILTERAQPLAVKEVMKATFEAFSMVLLAGGGSRMFSRMDHDMIAEDFGNLKRVFCTCGEGLIAEQVVEKEADVVEGVIALMGQATEQLVEDLSIIACEASGIGIDGAAGQKVPMPPTTGRWNRTDPNTILRVLCHRNDNVANSFLKKTFQLAKRR